MSKTVAAKKQPTTDTEEVQEPSITIIKEASARISRARLSWRIASAETTPQPRSGRFFPTRGRARSTTSGSASTPLGRSWTSGRRNHPSHQSRLPPLCTGSVNTRSFLLASLVNEGILQQVPDKKRHYQIGDTQSFLTGLDKLTATDSKSSKPNHKAKAKAGACMPKGKAKPATGK